MAPEDPIPALKHRLAECIVARVAGWAQVNAGALLGIDQRRVSELRRMRLHRFSLEQLIRLVTRVDGEVHVNVEWTDRHQWLYR